LLLIDATRFSRVGVTAAIFAAGFLPLNHTRKIANTPASTRKYTIRFCNLRSMLSYSNSNQFRRAIRHTCPSAPWPASILVRACLLLECPAASHSNNSRSAFSTIVPSKCLISNTIQMRRPRPRMRVPLPMKYSQPLIRSRLRTVASPSFDFCQRGVHS